MEGEKFVATSEPAGSTRPGTAFAHVADDLAHRAGFARCAVAVSRTADTCEVVAVHGDPVDADGKPLVEGVEVPDVEVQRLRDAGVGFGALTFVAAEWRGTTGGRELPDEPVPWRVGDQLVALARDVDGLVRGSVLLDAPLDGRRPTAERLLHLSEELHLPLGGLLGTIENEELSHQLQVARQMHELVRELDHRTTLDELVDLTRAPLRLAFRADDVALHLAADGDDPAVGDLTPSALLHDSVEKVVRRAWDAGDLVVIEPDGMRGAEHLDAGAADELLGLMDELEIETLVLVPLGAGGQCLGTLGVARGRGTPRWTAGESEAAVEVGRDLGRAVLNARRHEREQRLRNELERLDEYRSQMVSTISHELKNPIGVIQGHLELLGESAAVVSDPSARRSLEAIARGASRLATLADDLLLLSRVSDLDHRMGRTRVDLGALVREAVDFTHVTAELSGVGLSVEAVDEDVVVLGDRDALSLVVTNLLSNAVKYSDPGDAVRLQVLRRGGQVLLICADTGLGISEADRTRLFSEFFRSTNPEATSRPGTGLGLVIMQRVVARHGGHVRVESELGQGTTFQVSLPCASRGPGTPDGTAVSEGAAGPDDPALN